MSPTDIIEYEAMRALPRELAADAYDALELGAWVYGGIGAGEYTDPDDESVPVCAIGFTHGLSATTPERQEFRNALLSAGVTIVINDAAVRAINRRHFGLSLPDRVSFEDWCKELNVVRGN